MALSKNKNIEKKKSSKPKEENTEAIKGLRVNYLIIFLSGLVILIASILIFLLVIKNIYGRFEIDEILPSKKNIEAFAYKQKVALLYSKYTENMLEDGDTWIQDNLDTWKNFLKNMKIDYEIISDIDIEKGEHFKYKLLVLAGAKALSDREIRGLKKYIDGGGSVFATGGIATFSDEGKWKGWDFFTETFGMKFTKELSPDEILKKVHTLRGNLPLTAGIPTGYMLKIGTWDRPIYAEILEPRTTQVSYWYNFRWEKGLVDEQIQKSAGIAYGEYGKGRYVWYGFELNSVVGEQKDYIHFGRLVKNSIDWLLYNPTSFVKDWPAPYEAAAIFIPTIMGNFNNVDNLKRIVKSSGYDATIFIDPELALKYPKQTKSVASIGKIAPIIDLGFLESMYDTENSLDNKELQKANIEYVNDSLYKITNQEIKGLMPYYGFYDQTTLEVMAEENLNFIVTDSLTDRSVPQRVIMDGKQILVITKTARDDIKVIKEFGLTDTEFQKYTYFEDIDRVIFEGGLYVLKMHNNYQLSPQYSNILNDVTKYFHDHNVWVTSIPELMQWWKRKSGVEIRYETRSKRRISVQVANHRKDIDGEFVIQVNFNKPVYDIKISADMIHTPIPEFEFDTKTNILYIYIENLEQDESRTYLIDFENVNEDSENEIRVTKVEK